MVRAMVVGAVGRAWAWAREYPWTVGYIILVLAVVLSFVIDERQDEREAREDAVERVDAAEHDARTECRAGNDTRELIRGIGVDLSAGDAEALIIIFPEADPNVVEAYRTNIRANAEGVVSRLGMRDCVVEAAQARREAAEIEGIDP